jgi:lysyl-tRNA synthetase class 2
MPTNHFLQIQKQRAKILDHIRTFFKQKGFLEVSTPIFVELPGMEPYLNPLPYNFRDEKTKNYDGYVITSPEYSLKKLLSQGFPKLFEITKVFRQNESFGPTHNPEFTLIEWYRPHDNYRKIMKDTEELVLGLAQKLYHKKTITYQGQKIDLSLPWPRLSVKKAFQKYAGINLDKAKTLLSFKRVFKEKEYQLPHNCTWDDLFYYVFLNFIEPNFPKNRPIIVYDYPLPQAALAKPCSRITATRSVNKSRDSLQNEHTSFYAERFEAYIAGLEICNAFSELTDWQEQYKRLKSEQKLRQKLGKKTYDIDLAFIKALKSGLPETGGIALGIERLQMLLLNIQDINELLVLPAKELWRNNDK